jgi:CHAD domain-containing protein
LKLGVGSSFVLPDLDGVVEGVHAEDMPPADLKATYFDTEDLRLARWGGTLRFRSDQGWLVKLPAAEEGALLTRTEHQFDGPAGTPPKDARDLITAIVRSAELTSVLKLRTRRGGVRLVGSDGAPLAEVVDDEVSVLDGRRVAARFREVEVELAEKADVAVAKAVRARLESAGAGEPDPTPKHVRALGARATAPADVLSVPPKLSKGKSTAADLVKAALSASTARVVTHDPGIRLGLDPEDIHQARVGTRRLRADLRTFRPVLDTEWVNGLRAELKWLGGELGSVRDKDVMVELLRGAAADLLEEERRDAERLLSTLENEREEARGRALSTLSGDRYVLLLDRLVDASHRPVFAPGEGDKDAAELVGLGVRPWKKLRKAVKGLDERSEDEALHRVRILTKRSRYAAEALAPVAGKPARSFAKAAETLQDVLGRIQDASVAGEWLTSIVARAPKEQAFAAGKLAAAADAWSREARAEWLKAWGSLKKKRVPSSW